jgi:hypothetical protein
MKKLLVFAITAVMILSMAAISMAETTVGGELNFGYQLENAGAAKGDFGDAKITTNVKLGDNFNVFGAFKASDVTNKIGFDEVWGKFSEGFGTVQVGYWGQNTKDNMDILSAHNDIKPAEAIKATFNVAKGVTVAGYLSRPNMGTEDQGNLYGINPAYANDKWGVDAYYVASSEDGYALNDVSNPANSVMAVNGFFNLNTAAKVYANYTSVEPVTGDNVNKAYVGLSYDSADMPVYARVEAQVEKPDGQDSNALGFRVGYKINNNARIQYENINTGVLGDDTDKTSTLKLNVLF